MQNRIREVRKQHGLTMKQLGDKVGLSESTISQYENGKRQPANETLLKFRELFNVSVDELLGCESPNISQSNAIPVTRDTTTFDYDDLKNELIYLYDGLSKSDQDKVLSYLRFLSKNKD